MPAANRKGIRLLLVDDEPHKLEFLELGLSNEGFEIYTAADGESALERYREHQPHQQETETLIKAQYPGFSIRQLFVRSYFHQTIIQLNFPRLS